MNKVIAPLLSVIIIMQGCSLLSGLDTLNPFKEDKGIKATVQLGKENHNTSTEMKSLAHVAMDSTSTVNNEVDAEVVNQYTEGKDSPWLIWSFAIALAVAIPSPLSYLGQKGRITKLEGTIDELRQDLRRIRREAKNLSVRSREDEDPKETENT